MISTYNLFLFSGQNNWLQLDRKVLDHDFSKTSEPLELNFLVRWVLMSKTFADLLYDPS